MCMKTYFMRSYDKKQLNRFWIYLRIDKKDLTLSVFDILAFTLLKDRLTCLLVYRLHLRFHAEEDVIKISH